MLLVYAIEHRSGRVYIGKTSDRAVRWGGHRYQLKRGTHPNIRLQRAWDRDGETAFTWYEIDRYDHVTTQDEAECFYIAWFQALKLSYNFRSGGDGGRHSPETRIRISAVQKGRPSPLRGRTLSPAHIEKLRLSHKGHRPTFTPEQQAKGNAVRRGQKRSQKARARMSSAMKERLKDPAQQAQFLQTQAKGLEAMRGHPKFARDRPTEATRRHLSTALKAYWAKKKGDSTDGTGGH